MEKEILAIVLRKHLKETTPMVFTEVTAEPGAGKGQNYTSDIIRLRAKVVLGNGRIRNKTFILKKEIPKENMGTIVKKQHIFKKETKVYTAVLKEMENLMDEFGDTEEPLWGQLLHYEPYTTMLLEDLQSLGYQTINHQIGMDLEHGLLALRGIAKYHGMMKVLESRGIVSKDDHPPHMASDQNFLEKVIFPGIQNMIKAVKEHWGPDWTDVGKKLSLPLEQFSQRVLNAIKWNESDFAVQNHGDCWSSNIMFKYDWQRNPVSVRFVDFQLPHYNTPCMDISNLMYLSIQPSVRRENYDILLENYHDSLISTLDKYEYNEKRPSIEEISNVMERVSFFWLYVYACWYPLLTHESNELMQKFMQTDKVEDTAVYSGESIEEKLGPDLISLVKKHLST